MTEIEDVDRISSLPDEILTHILSFMHTKEAVATSVLSKRWEFIWTRVPVIDLFEYKIMQSSLSFKAFVDRVLILNDAPFLRLFRLHFRNDIDILHFCSWMRNVMRRNIFEIEVGCMPLPKKITRPLKGNLVSENLKNLGSVCFRSSSLRRLEMQDIVTRLQNPTVIIDAPSLEYLFNYNHVSDIKALFGEPFQPKLKINAPSLAEAQFRIRGYGLVEMLKQIPSLKTLDIVTTEWFHDFAGELRAVNQLPIFPKLTCLDVGSWLSNKHPSHLMMLVLLCEHAPNLVSLKYGVKRLMLDRKREEPSDLPPTVVPKCLSSTLKVIDIYSYQMIDHVVTRYLLQYATVLQIIRIHLKRSSMKEIDAISKLMEIPIASSVCKIVICRDPSNL
ncbi:F-box/FBD/LRR-repeat protein At4g26340-like [Beta vulgaris subsp. vulgaris]|uniref:F-box/FBD/LRR-repeat protein At4g26340-like n=1 Tax=Beta vulgaris subsp. vulgaris TaxID=3555 RepID=UPI0020373D8E|nr:F-box/FBD/LRR-repeat protein At4g26340-like [Beta vulgaris subsp. vulgaris]